jgi:hypothetical protein
MTFFTAGSFAAGSALSAGQHRSHAPLRASLAGGAHRLAQRDAGGLERAGAEHDREVVLRDAGSGVTGEQAQRVDAHARGVVGAHDPGPAGQRVDERQHLAAVRGVDRDHLHAGGDGVPLSALLR